MNLWESISKLSLKNTKDGSVWCLANVYGQVMEEKKKGFLEEVKEFVNNNIGQPLIIGGL